LTFGMRTMDAASGSNPCLTVIRLFATDTPLLHAQTKSTAPHAIHEMLQEALAMPNSTPRASGICLFADVRVEYAGGLVGLRDWRARGWLVGFYWGTFV